MLLVILLFGFGLLKSISISLSPEIGIILSSGLVLFLYCEVMGLVIVEIGIVGEMETDAHDGDMRGEGKLAYGFLVVDSGIIEGGTEGTIVCCGVWIESKGSSGEGLTEEGLVNFILLRGLIGFRLLWLGRVGKSGWSGKVGEEGTWIVVISRLGWMMALVISVLLALLT